MHRFRIQNKLAPKYLLPNFTSVSAAHSHNTRGSEYNFVLSRDLSRSQSSFSFVSIKHWNSLPTSIKSIGEFRVFKRKLKEFLISQYNWFYGFCRTDFPCKWFWLFTILRFYSYFSCYEFLLSRTPLEKSCLIRLSWAIHETGSLQFRCNLCMFLN